MLLKCSGVNVCLWEQLGSIYLNDIETLVACAEFTPLFNGSYKLDGRDSTIFKMIRLLHRLRNSAENILSFVMANQIKNDVAWNSCCESQYSPSLRHTRGLAHHGKYVIDALFVA